MKIRDTLALMNGTTEDIFEIDNGIDILDDDGKILYSVTIDDDNNLRVSVDRGLNIKPVASNVILINFK